MYYADYVLKFLSYFLLAKFTVIRHRNIMLYMITVLMFFFSFAIHFFRANLVPKDCYNCCMPYFSFS